MARNSTFPTSPDLSRQALPSAMNWDPAVRVALAYILQYQCSSHVGGGCVLCFNNRNTAKLNDGTENAFFQEAGRVNYAESHFRRFFVPICLPTANMTLSKSIYHSSPSSARCCTFTITVPAIVLAGPFASNPSTSFLFTDFSLIPRYARNPLLLRWRQTRQLHTNRLLLPDGYDAHSLAFLPKTCCCDTPQ